MVEKKVELQVMVEELLNEVHTLSMHLFTARWQQLQFTCLLKNLKPGFVVLNMDFAKNYACVAQQEIQSAHWGHGQISIHPTIAYYRCDKKDCDGIIREAIIFVSNDLTHDSHAVNCFVGITNKHLKEKGTFLWVQAWERAI